MKIGILVLITFTLYAQERYFSEIDFVPTGAVANPRALDPNLYSATFILQNDAVGTSGIQSQAVTANKIGDGEVPISKLNPLGTNTPVDGYALKWAGTGFIFSPDIPSSPPTGGVQSIVTQVGGGLILNPSTIVATGTVAVDVGTDGNNKVPFFNSSSELVLSDQVKLRFNNGSSFFEIDNEGDFLVKHSSRILPLLEIDPTGNAKVTGPISVGGIPVCMSDGTNCPVGVSGIRDINTVAPILGGTSSGTATISASVGSSPNQLLWMDPVLGVGNPGALPAIDGANLSGVVHQVNPGTAISVSNLLGNYNVGLRFGGPGLAQSFGQQLNTLGSLNPFRNFVIMGIPGNTFDVIGGTTLQSNMGLLPGRDVQVWYQGLTDISNIAYPPASNKYISGNGTAWTAKDIPSCSAGYVVLGGNNNFLCSGISTNFSVGTFVSNSSPGFQLRAANAGTGPTGELRLMGTNGKYLGFKAPSTATNTTWTLPAADGASGTFISTNGTGTLSFASSNNGDVSGPAASSQTYIPIFADNTGKLLKNQTTIMVDTVNSRVGVKTSTPANKLSIVTANSGDGLVVGQNFLGRCGLGANFACLSHPNFSTSTVSYSFAQDDTGNTFINAATGQGIYLRINNSDEGIVDSNSRLGIGTTTPTKPLHVLGAGGSNGGILGNTYIGQTATHGVNWAGFLYNGLGDNSYGLLQNNVGVTLLNAATGENIYFRINNGDEMIMTSAGRLGLGTTGPGELVTLNGGNLRIQGSTSPKVILRSNQSDSSNSGELVFLESDINFGWKIRHNSTNAGAPSNSVDTLQFFRRDNAIDTEEFQMAANGQLWARDTNIGALSDISLKRDISDFSTDSGDIIKKFRPVKFKWASGELFQDNDEHIGFLAQEVQKIDPRFVMRNPIHGKLMIKYDELLPVMIADLKRLNQENEALEKEIADRKALKEEYLKLSKEFEILESRLKQ